MRLCVCQEGYSWLDLLQSFGWDTFNIIDLEDFQESDIKVRLKLDSWIDSIAENNAWQVVYNGEARSW